MGVKARQQRESDAMIERLLAAPDDVARRDLIAHHASADWDEIVSILTDRAREEVHVDTAQAQYMAETAVLVAEAAGSKIAQGKGWRAKANTLYALDQHAAAVEMHQRAAALFEQAGEQSELGRTLSGSIQF